MKNPSYLSNLFKGSVLSLILLVFLQASSASASIPIGDQTQLEAIGENLGGDYVVVNSFEVVVPSDGGSTYVTGTFTGTFDGGGYLISGLTRPLFDIIGSDGVVGNLNLKADLVTDQVIGRGVLANESYGTINSVNTEGDVFSRTNGVGGLAGYSAGSISNSSATGDVTGPSYVGGLVGYSDGSISNSSATGDVTGDLAGDGVVGGLVGDSDGSISNSSATGDVTGPSYVGGLVGDSGGSISNSSASGDVNGSFYVGGLVGNSTSSISESFAEGDVISVNAFTGGLVGYSTANISNSYATGNVTGSNDVGGLVGYQVNADVSNSYASGDVTGVWEVGGLVGYQVNGIVSNSYASGDVTGSAYVGGLIGTNYSASPEIRNTYAAGSVSGYRVVGGLVGDNFATITSSYSVGVVTGSGGDYIGNFLGGWNVEITDDSGKITSPLLSSEVLNIINTRLVGSPIYAQRGTANNSLPYLTSNPPRGMDDRHTENTPAFSLRTFYTQAAQSLEKALTSLGFKSNFSPDPNLGFQALESNQGNLPAAIQLFEVAEYQNSNILLNKEDGLQLSITSYYKEPLEIWTQGLDGAYLYLGRIEFDENGKAILPTLKFTQANSYQLLLIKAASEQSKQPNLEVKIGQINITVN